MVEEGIFPGIEDVDSEIVAVVEVAECVGAGAETVIVVEAETVIVVGVETETVNVAGAGAGAVNDDGVGAETVNVAGVGVGVGTANIDGAETVDDGWVGVGAVNMVAVETVIVGVHDVVVNVVEEGYIEDVDSAIVTEVGPETVTVGLVDDAVIVQIHNGYVTVEVRVGLGVVIGNGVDTSVVVTGFEIVNWVEVEPKGQHNCCMTNFQDMHGEHKNTLQFWVKQVFDAFLG